MADAKVVRKTVHSGKGDMVQLTAGTKVVFNYQALVETSIGTDSWVVIDDTRKRWPDGYGRPLEIVIGKKFQLPIFETLLASMQIDEVSQFDVDTSQVQTYPMVSKKLRDLSKSSFTNNFPIGRCCGANSGQGTGYAVLDDLMANPRTVRFIMHLLSVLQPGQYQPDDWQLSSDERLQSVTAHRDAGNSLVANGDWSSAVDQYKTALSLLEGLMLREKPGDADWSLLNNLNTPLFLNLAQCHLKLDAFYEAIEAADEALQRDENNEKGLFRRAKARMAVWDLELARKDLNKLIDMKASCVSVAKELLEDINMKERVKSKADQHCYKAMFTK